MGDESEACVSWDRLESMSTSASSPSGLGLLNKAIAYLAQTSEEQYRMACLTDGRVCACEVRVWVAQTWKRVKRSAMAWQACLRAEKHFDYVNQTFPSICEESTAVLRALLFEFPAVTQILYEKLQMSR